MEDPVGTEALDQLADLEAAEVDAALKLMALKKEEVKLVALGRRIEEERGQIFERLLRARGFVGSTPATIDSKTGKITLVDASRSRRAHAQ